jgi:hypothetical protein
MYSIILLNSRRKSLNNNNHCVGEDLEKHNWIYRWRYEVLIGLFGRDDEEREKKCITCKGYMIITLIQRFS